MATAVEAQKPAPEKKAKSVPKGKKAKTAKTASHPPYFEMIKEALLALKEKGGSSPYAIAKYMEDKHKAVLPANFRKILGLQIKNSASKGKLIKIKASYKLSESEKKEKAAATVKPAVKKSTAAVVKKANVAKAGGAAPAAGTKRKAEVVKKAAVKKVTKKATTKKAKQPKSIKSSAAKRAKRVAAA